MLSHFLFGQEELLILPSRPIWFLPQLPRDSTLKRDMLFVGDASTWDTALFTTHWSPYRTPPRPPHTHHTGWSLHRTAQRERRHLKITNLTRPHLAKGTRQLGSTMTNYFVQKMEKLLKKFYHCTYGNSHKGYLELGETIFKSPFPPKKVFKGIVL